jgi:hypothetical protein
MSEGTIARDLRGFTLKFSNQGGILFPADRKLYALAIEFAAQHLGQKINFTDYETVLVVAECDDNGEPLKVLAMNARVPRWDYPVWRFVDDRAASVLIERTRAKLDDEGQRGGEVFVSIANREDSKSRCPRWRKFLRLVGAERASRWKVPI